VDFLCLFPGGEPCERSEQLSYRGRSPKEVPRTRGAKRGSHFLAGETGCTAALREKEKK